MQQDDSKIDENELIAQRRAKLQTLREQHNAYPNTYRPEHHVEDVFKQYDLMDAEQLANVTEQFRIAGRIMLRRQMGKASFINIQDKSGRLQIYLREADLPEGQYSDFKTWDIGDLIGVQGRPFRTKTGELSLYASQIELVTKSLRPLPDKYHGLNDQELRYRQRYVDLIVNEKTREVFNIRSQIINQVRSFLQVRGFMEVETPMMQVIPGGATAKPFVTHHNALDMPLYLRVAPELYLKRLIVGGLERVFEINRNFRNEGLSTRHNPEFTMVEFYQAYADYKQLMDLTETLFKDIAMAVFGRLQFQYQGIALDFSQPFVRMTVKESLQHYHPEWCALDLEDMSCLRDLAKKLDLSILDSDGVGKLQFILFEETVEDKLLQPTFITAHPAETSPLARRNDEDPSITDRFELFIAGREIANAFSELNDPDDQATRFHEQARAHDAGDEEAMHFDADYVTALEYGMPPTAGEGIGIDRLVMLFTDSASIRDVILFPHMRPL